MRKIGQKLRSLSWTIGTSDRQTDRQLDIHSSDSISVQCHALHWTDNNTPKKSLKTISRDRNDGVFIGNADVLNSSVTPDFKPEVKCCQNCACAVKKSVKSSLGRLEFSRHAQNRSWWIYFPLSNLRPSTAHVPTLLLQNSPKTVSHVRNDAFSSNVTSQ